ncbi:hypothetical protein [Ensifer sp. 22460]|uniref:hypothetical protein n=1 Tax=Ensifer sp. 22460 TaxID=3453922 RepID=UPI003F834950
MQPNGGIKTRNTLQRMAKAMVEVGEGCTAEDLKRRNFTPDQIGTLGPKASEIATDMAQFA